MDRDQPRSTGAEAMTEELQVTHTQQVTYASHDSHLGKWGLPLCSGRSWVWSIMSDRWMRAPLAPSLPSRVTCFSTTASSMCTGPDHPRPALFAGPGMVAQA